MIAHRSFTQLHAVVFQAVSKINLAVRGLYGEGTQASGDFYQISNQVTLGKSENEIIENLGSVIPQIVKYERKVRSTLLQMKRLVLEDKIWRALGVLRFARTITSEETLELLSLVRLGVNLGAIEGISIATINELFVLTQPAQARDKANTLSVGTTIRWWVRFTADLLQILDDRAPRSSRPLRPDQAGRDGCAWP